MKFINLLRLSSAFLKKAERYFIPPDLMHDHNLITHTLTSKLAELGISNDQYTGQLKWIEPSANQIGLWQFQISPSLEVETKYPNLQQILEEIFNYKVKTEQMVKVVVLPNDIMVL